MERKTSEELKKAMVLFMRMDRMRKCMFEKITEDLGICRGQYEMLADIARHTGIATQRDIASDLGITPAAVTVAIKKLEADGYVERRMKTEDNRANEIFVTKKGKSILDKVKKSFCNIDTVMLDSFTDEELKLFISYLVRSLNNLEQIDCDCIKKPASDAYFTCLNGKDKNEALA